MGGRPRLPAAVLELSGALRHNPGRRRREPKTKGALGGPPEHFLTDSGRMNKYPEIWDELAAQVPVGVATFSDRVAFETLVKLTAELRRPGKPDKGLAALQDRLLTRFAMNPQGRAAQGVAEALAEAPKDEFEQFMRGSKKVG